MTAKLQGVKKGLKEIKQKVKDIADRNKQINSVWLFGSFAREKQTPISDIDIAFLPQKNLTPEDTEVVDRKFYLGLAVALGTDDITLINMNEASIGLAYSALRGRLLFCRDKMDLARYKEKVLDLYPEIDRLRKLYVDSYLKKIAAKK